MTKRAIITGASGHLGFYIAQAALHAGLDVELLVRRTNRNVEALMASGAGVSLNDFADPASLRRAMENCNVLFHAAAANTTDTKHPEAVLAATHGLAERVLNAAVDAAVPRVVYTSSVVVLGRSSDPARLITEADRIIAPESPYVEGKLLAEQHCEKLIRERNLDLRRLYPSWLVGPNDTSGTPPQKLIANYVRKGQRFWFDGGISIASVVEAGRAHVAAALNETRCATYVLGGENVTFQQLYGSLAELTGRRPPMLRLPKGLMIAAATALNGLSPVSPAYVRSVVGFYSWYDSSKAVRELGYRIPPVREVLQAGL